MEPITLVTTALSLATPFLIKTGEKIAENIGEDIWNLIKKPFSKKKQEALESDLQKDSEKKKIIEAIVAKLNSDLQYKVDLENAVDKAQKELNAYYQQNINNNGNIAKQINIQNVTGNITL
jgi:organic radical activating enzyme